MDPNSGTLNVPSLSNLLLWTHLLLQIPLANYRNTPANLGNSMFSGYYYLLLLRPTVCRYMSSLGNSTE